MNNEPFKLFTIFQYNGKDLFLQGLKDRDDFVVMSFNQLSHEFREFASKWIGRDVRKYSDGRLELIKTRQEIQEECDRRHRHLEIRRDIMALEAKTENITEYDLSKLEKLRDELKQYEHVDPTAITLEQQRANESLERPTFKLRNERE